MKRETRTAVYDEELRIEAYRFEGIMQPFPNHFHRHYVIGLVERGKRALTCRNREYVIGQGSVLLFNPGDNHGCGQRDGGTFDYRGINIPEQVMLDLAEEVTGERALPGFSENVVGDREIGCELRALHEMIMEETGDFGREETLLFLVSRLMESYGRPFKNCVPECRREIEKACEYMERHFAERIYLDQICRYAGLSKSALLRAFTKEKGVTPYRYLEAVRIGAAKNMLADGMPPAETAVRTGFSDQSHFTNYFSQFIGLAPGLYREMFSRQGKDVTSGRDVAGSAGGHEDAGERSGGKEAGGRSAVKENVDGSGGVCHGK